MVRYLSTIFLMNNLTGVGSGMMNYTAMVTTELIRLTIFYKGGRYDVSGVYNLDASESNNQKVREELLTIVVDMAVQLRHLNPTNWDGIISSISSSALEEKNETREKNRASSFVHQIIVEFQQLVVEATL